MRFFDTVWRLIFFRKAAVLVLMLVFCQPGCSKGLWLANLYAVRAENALDKASSLKAKKVPFKSRMGYYSQACDLFVKAFEANADVFTLSRIEMASDCCWKAEKNDARDFFNTYFETYIKEHPQEYEHGDSGVAMIDVGG